MESQITGEKGAEMAKIAHRDLLGWNSVRRMPDADGKTEVYKWFGFKNHLLCDTTYQA